MKTSITVITTFSAAHRLPAHPGKCRNLHGHTYRLEVTVSGSVKQEGPETGMVMDFSELRDRVVELVVEPLDHQYLNQAMSVVPTAEAIAAWAFERLADKGVPVTRVRLWEGPATYVEIS